MRYALTSANDAPGRDPQDWTLEGSQDGQSWTVLDTQTGQSFGERFQTKEYAFSNSTAYRHYRLNVTRNHGDGILQLAELQLSKGGENPPPAPEMRSMVGGGPTSGYNAKSSVGWTGVRALQYGGEHTADGRAYSYNKVFDVNVKVRRDSELSYLIFPEFERDDLRYPSTYASVDLAFTDGTYLHELDAIDQHGARAEPARPGPLEDALRQPVEPQGQPHRRGRGRQDDRPHPRRLRQPRRAGDVRRLDRRHRDRAASPPEHAAQPPVGLGADDARHELERQLLAAATTSRRPRSRTASTSGRR